MPGRIGSSTWGRKAATSGEVVSEGTSEETARNPKSYTGRYLKQVLALKALGARAVK
jgi:hypothetical protein